MMTTGRSRGRRVALGLMGASCVVGGCTLINSYDGVVPEKPGAPDAARGVDSSLPGDDAESVDSGPSRDDGGLHDAAAEEAAAVAAAHGVIVIGGETTSDAGRQVVLTAIDPSTGSELPKARRPLNVAAVRYDGKRDLWYVFESGGQGLFALPTDPFYLHTFDLDTITGQWTELGVFQIPTGVSFATTTVILERLSYIAYGNGTVDGGLQTAGGPYSLVTLDTSDPTAVSVLGAPIPLATGYGALIGIRSDVNAAGGYLALGSTAKLDGGATVSLLTPVVVPGSGSPALLPPIFGTAPAGQLVGYGSVTDNGATHALVVTRPNGSVPATLSVFDLEATDPTMALIGAGTFPFADGNVQSPAFAGCGVGLALVAGTNSDLSVHAVSIAGIDQADGGVYPALTSASAATGHSGQGVYFEPYTNTVLAPFSQGDNFALTAFTLEGSSDAPRLVQRLPPRWVPPPDLRPSFVATKSPVPDVCTPLGDN
jgi:hypothetical protein